MTFILHTLAIVLTIAAIPCCLKWRRRRAARAILLALVAANAALYFFYQPIPSFAYLAIINALALPFVWKPQ